MSQPEQSSRPRRGSLGARGSGRRPLPPTPRQGPAGRAPGGAPRGRPGPGWGGPPRPVPPAGAEAGPDEGGSAVAASDATGWVVVGVAWAVGPAGGVVPTAADGAPGAALPVAVDPTP